MFRNRFTDHIRLIILFTLIYMILSESFSLLTAFLGMVSGSAAIWLTNKILEIDYVEMFHINFWLFLIYFWIVLRDTYVAGLDTIIRIFKGTIKPSFVTYQSHLNDEFLTVLLANAITMPPGSITVDRDGDEMTILHVGFEEKEFIHSIETQIEALLKQFDSHKEGE